MKPSLKFIKVKECVISYVNLTLTVKSSKRKKLYINFCEYLLLNSEYTYLLSM